jgi:hypothetical protein
LEPLDYKDFRHTCSCFLYLLLSLVVSTRLLN